MGDSKLPRGVEIRGDAVYIHFTEKGCKKRYKKTDFPSTPAGIKSAGKQREKIVHEIKYDTFSPGDYFPDEKSSDDFFTWGQRWLDDPSHDWSENSRKKYKMILNNFWIPWLSDLPVHIITHAHLLDAIKKSDIGEKSASFYNDALTTLRGIFDLADVEPDPARKLKNKRRVEPTIDPFTFEEADLIIDHIYTKEGDMWGAWFELGFYTGMRSPGEMLGLMWPDIDFRSKQFKVQRQRLTSGNIQEWTKTRKSRVVRLNCRSLNALQKAKAMTFLAGDFVFKHDDGEDLKSGKIQRRLLKSTLKKLGIRERPMYNMRHTYASNFLTLGLNPAYLCKQMGNSLAEFLKTYAKFIEQGQGDIQAKLMDAALSSSKNLVDSVEGA